MVNDIRIWIGRRYRSVLDSIAFYPAFIGLLFLLLSFLMYLFDFSELGIQIKSQWNWLKLKDATTARSIISSVAAGILSLTVFSFSMVMIVLNQAASQMSNRILDKLIGNRFQQVVLGVYIGTIVYALFLLSTIRDIDSGLSIPALSTYLLILITILDIFIFIYFLHYITQSVRYEVIIHRIFKITFDSLQHACTLPASMKSVEPAMPSHVVMAKTSGIYEGFNEKALVDVCEDARCSVQMIHPRGTFVLKGTPLMKVDILLSDEKEDELHQAINLNKSESIEANYLYGFRQLMEIALKALSPGINDPGTAIVSLRALFELFSFRVHAFPDGKVRNEKGDILISETNFTLDQLFSFSIMPIWDYGKNDRLIQQELSHLLAQLILLTPNAHVLEKLHGEVTFALRQRENDEPYQRS